MKDKPIRAYAAIIFGKLDLRTIRDTRGKALIAGRTWNPRMPVTAREVVVL